MKEQNRFVLVSGIG